MKGTNPLKQGEVKKALTIGTKRPVNQSLILEQELLLLKYLLFARYGCCVSFLTAPASTREVL